MRDEWLAELGLEADADATLSAQYRNPRGAPPTGEYRSAPPREGPPPPREADEGELLIGQLAQRSSRLVHDLNNGLTRALGRSNLLMQAMRDGRATEQDVQALQLVHRDLVELARGLMREVVVPARAHLLANPPPMVDPPTGSGDAPLPERPPEPKKCGA